MAFDPNNQAQPLEPDAQREGEDQQPESAPYEVLKPSKKVFLATGAAGDPEHPEVGAPTTAGLFGNEAPRRDLSGDQPEQDDQSDQSEQGEQRLEHLDPSHDQPQVQDPGVAGQNQQDQPQPYPWEQAQPQPHQVDEQNNQ